jgi:ketosteroid isomerase-like protein
MSDLDTTVRRLADLEAIRDLARRYAHCVFQTDAAGAVDLFTEDGVIDMGDRPPIAGRDALREVYEATLGQTMLQPFVHNHVIDLEDDHATGVCYLDLRGATGAASMIGSGYYHDDYVRVGDAWKFRSRKLTMSFWVPLAEGWAKA